ncbi:MAG: hypothetical protein ACFFEM_16020 [Candidatus Thorarchaeota archaeon]
MRKPILKIAIGIIERHIRAYDSQQAEAIAGLPLDPRYDEAVCIIEEKAVRLSEACQLLKSELT